jgi:hypothetical protein
MVSCGQRWPLPARYWNVCRYFADKKKTTQKFEKTAESTAKALKAAERKAQQTLKQAQDLVLLACHICTGTGLAPPASASGPRPSCNTLRSRLSHLRMLERHS